MSYSWTPIYSGVSKKLIAGVTDNRIFEYMEDYSSPDGGTWVEVGYIKDNKVYSSCYDNELVGEVDQQGDNFYCVINREERINYFLNRAKNEWPESVKEERIKKLRGLFLRLSVARVLYSTSDFSSVFICETGEAFSDEKDLHRSILFANSRSSDETANPFDLAAAFVIIQFHPTFDNHDRPLKELWDF